MLATLTAGRAPADRACSIECRESKRFKPYNLLAALRCSLEFAATICRLYIAALYTAYGGGCSARNGDPPAHNSIIYASSKLIKERKMQLPGAQASVLAVRYIRESIQSVRNTLRAPSKHEVPCAASSDSRALKRIFGHSSSHNLHH